jgi:hypothetical protein
MRFQLSTVRKTVLCCGLFAALLVFPALSLAKCSGVHLGSRYIGWDKPLTGNNWPYYEKGRGLVRLTNSAKADQVYVNGCNVGQASKIDRFWLDPGKYNISINRSGTNVLNQKVSIKNGEAITLNIGNNTR